MEDTNTETPYNCRQFPYLNLKWKNTKNMWYVMENPNTETTNDCRQFRYLNYNW